MKAERTLTVQQIEYPAQNKEAPDLERFFICNNHMVREVDSRWNHFVPSLYLMHSKLEKIGIAFINSKIVYIGDEELGDV